MIVPFAVLKKGNIFGGGGEGDGKGGGGKEPEPIVTDLARKISFFDLLVGSLKSKSPDYNDFESLKSSFNDILKYCEEPEKLRNAPPSNPLQEKARRVERVLFASL